MIMITILITYTNYHYELLTDFYVSFKVNYIYIYKVFVLFK